MKKVLSLALCLLMVAVCICGCGSGSSSELEGEWKGIIDYSKVMENTFEEMGQSMEDIDLDLYKIEMTMTFKDGIYTISSAGVKSAEGKFKAEDGKLYTSADKNTDIDEKIYETYTLKGDTLTLTSSSQEELNEIGVYPMVFTKVK